MTVLIALLAFMFGSLLVTAAALALAPNAAGAIERRLGEVTDCKWNWFTYGGRARNRGTEVSGFENSQGFNGIIVLGEHHHLVAM